MKKLIIIIVLLIVSKICMSQDFIFDQKNKTMNIPPLDPTAHWEIGSSSLRVILLDDNQKADTIFTSLGCSQYLLEATEEYIDLQIYIWPFYFYRTDCALEDSDRPEKKDGDLLIRYLFRSDSITAEIKWNVEKHTDDSIYSSISYDDFGYKYLTSVFSLIQQGKTVEEIIDSLLIDNQKRKSDEFETMYRNDVLINLLPLNNRILSSSEIYILTKCLDRIHKKYKR